MKARKRNLFAMSSYKHRLVQVKLFLISFLSFKLFSLSQDYRILIAPSVHWPSSWHLLENSPSKFPRCSNSYCICPLLPPRKVVTTRTRMIDHSLDGWFLVC
uniref:ATP-dependent RNA helicase DBP7 n=1 Tax=Cryptococcus bacillisporus CA1280 TaxID=1296109 RepID=A0A0D0VIG6_CRYGA|nr:ATP-dependent RNA helicase DBP7 [Cryptococcus bacillisporus CA1280]